MNPELRAKIERLQGPILVLGASGFVGANLFRMLLAARSDVYGTKTQQWAWRLEGLPEQNILVTDLLVDTNIKTLVDTVRPRTVFDCVAYGAYSFETDFDLIYRTNVNYTVKLLEELRKQGAVRYIHAGSSSEYGDNASGPAEDARLAPNSHYAVSKMAVAGLLHYYGKKLRFPCANLRLYSIYGPYEDAARLIPALIAKGLAGKYPPLVNPDISRDFVYVDDACEAFIDAALNLREEDWGESFNIGGGVRTKISDMAAVARGIFGIAEEPKFEMQSRAWDVQEWYADPAKAKRRIGWAARATLRDGLLKTVDWYKGLKDPEKYHRSSKQRGVDTVYSISAIVACYKDGQAIPIMHERLVKVFAALNIDYEIIFVNDNSPDNSEEVIRAISARDRHVVGITHSRNFGSQAAFRSGMEIATKNGCVLMDGDLQDPPEIIEQFMEKWKEGYEVVYGVRVKREAPLHMQFAYKLFYRVFDWFSYLNIPHDAGDFSLLDKKVVKALVRFPERDAFMRGLRAYAGFRQTGIPYVRPERMFGVSTNSLLKNIDWAKKGILSFSNTPLNMLSFAGWALFGVSALLTIIDIILKLIFPDIAPKGTTTVLLTVVFFGSINLLALSIVGEYIAKIFEEVKQRPRFIRRNIVMNGEVRQASETQARGRE
ncbi:MAG: NAD-dependent epimerase/dehydratase family protein [Nitrospinae bacterium]|nr:NAD-dependent epimerase/dehydratase family protein [Nitrospinota bacterium]